MAINIDPSGKKLIDACDNLRPKSVREPSSSVAMIALVKLSLMHMRNFVSLPRLKRTTQAHSRQEEKMAACCSKQEEDLQTAE